MKFISNHDGKAEYLTQWAQAEGDFHRLKSLLKHWN